MPSVLPSCSRSVKVLLFVLIALSVIAAVGFLSPPLELTVLSLAPRYGGVPTTVRVWLCHRHTRTPVGGAAVEVRLHREDETTVLCQTKTAQDGSALCQLTLPPTAGRGQLIFRAARHLAIATVETKVSWHGPVQADLWVDRPVVRPGASFSARLLARHYPSGTPFSKRPITMQLCGPQGKSLFSETVRTNEYGVCSASFPLDSRCRVGRYRVLAHCAGNTVRAAVEVSRRQRDRLTVQVLQLPTKPLTFGSSFEVAFRLVTWDGEPLAGSLVTCSIIVRGREKPIARFAALVDEDGLLAARLRVPSLSDLRQLPPKTAQWQLQIDSQSQDGSCLSRSYPLAVSVANVSLSLARLPSSRAGMVRVVAWSDDVGTSYGMVRGDGSSSSQAITTGSGREALFSIPYSSEEEHVVVRARRGDETAVRRVKIKDLPLAQSRGHIVSERVSNAASLTCSLFSPERQTLSAHVIVDGHCLHSSLLDVTVGRKTYQLPLPPSVPPGRHLLMIVEGNEPRCVLNDGFELEDAVPLQLSVIAAQPRLAPGARTTLHIRAHRGGRPAGRCLIGVSAWDCAVAGAQADRSWHTNGVARAVQAQCLVSQRNSTLVAGPWQELGALASEFLRLLSSLFSLLIALALCIPLLRRIYRHLAVTVSAVDAINLAELRRERVVTEAVLVVGIVFALTAPLFVVPQFRSIFASMNVELPLGTQCLLKSTEIAQSAGPFILPVIALFVLGGLRLNRFLFTRAIAKQGRWLLAANFIVPMLVLVFMVLFSIPMMLVGMPMLKLVNCVGGDGDGDGWMGGGSSFAMTGPNQRSFALNGFTPLANRGQVRRRFPESLLVRPAIVTDERGAATVALPPSDAITSYEIRAEANTLDGGRARGRTRITYQKELHVTPYLPARLWQGDVVEVPVVVSSAAKAEQDIETSVSLRRAGSQSWQRLHGQTVRARWGRPARLIVELPCNEVGRSLLRIEARSGTTQDCWEGALEIRAHGVPCQAREYWDGHGQSREFVVADGAASPELLRHYEVWAIPGVLGSLLSTLQRWQRRPVGTLDDVLVLVRCHRALLTLLSSMEDRASRDLQEHSLAGLKQLRSLLARYQVDKQGWFGQYPDRSFEDSLSATRAFAETWHCTGLLAVPKETLLPLLQRYVGKACHDEERLSSSRSTVTKGELLSVLERFCLLAAIVRANPETEERERWTKLRRRFYAAARRLQRLALALDHEPLVLALNLRQCHALGIECSHGRGKLALVDTSTVDVRTAAAVIAARSVLADDHQQGKQSNPAHVQALIERHWQTTYLAAGDCLAIIDAINQAVRLIPQPRPVTVCWHGNGETKEQTLSGFSPIRIAVGQTKNAALGTVTTSRANSGWHFYARTSWQRAETDHRDQGPVERLELTRRIEEKMLVITLNNASSRKTGVIMIRCPLPAGAVVQSRADQANGLEYHCHRDGELQLWCSTLFPAEKRQFTFSLDFRHHGSLTVPRIHALCEAAPELVVSEGPSGYQPAVIITRAGAGPASAGRSDRSLRR